MNQEILRYDESELVKALTDLDATARVVFAASCAERLRAVYRWFHQRTGQGDPSVLEGALDALWASLEDDGAPAASWPALLGGVMELVPDEDDDTWRAESAYAQNAAAAAAYALRCRQEADPQEAGWAARQVYEALDHWVTTRDDVDVGAAGAQQTIDGDRLVQAELSRQQREVAELRAARGRALPALAAEIRRRSREAGSTLFGIPM